jgi:hypothetical protein
MHIHELGAYVEAIDCPSDEIGADAAFLDLLNADTAAKPGQRRAGLGFYPSIPSRRISRVSHFSSASTSAASALANAFEISPNFAGSRA